ncbi:MAG: molybdopterin molybdotransferase MoeA, partial [Bacteroidota bacterium]
MISAQEASEIILSAVCTIGQETVDLTAAHERVLAENIIATENIPPFDNSAMDGYAVCGEDVANPPVMLTLVGEVSAGQAPARGLQRGEAIRIMTGGQLPPGANAVVQLEWTEVVNDGRVRIQRPVMVGHNIRRAGEDIQEGQTVLEGGRELRAAELGVLASLGLKSVEVHRVPHVAILATGNELIEGDKPLEPGKIRNS